MKSFEKNFITQEFLLHKTHWIGLDFFSVNFPLCPPPHPSAFPPQNFWWVLPVKMALCWRPMPIHSNSYQQHSITDLDFCRKNIICSCTPTFFPLSFLFWYRPTICHFCKFPFILFQKGCLFPLLAHGLLADKFKTLDGVCSLTNFSLHFECDPVELFIVSVFRNRKGIGRSPIFIFIPIDINLWKYAENFPKSSKCICINFEYI